jgi:hypothetical protein
MQEAGAQGDPDVLNPVVAPDTKILTDRSNPTHDEAATA